MNEIALWIVDAVGGLGYVGIFVLMFLESSFFPFPSEVVMPPAGYLASRGEMSLFLSVVAGTAGSLAGALFNYFLASTLGREAVIRYGKYFFFTEEKLRKVEQFFEKHGAISMFLGRLMPGVRQYISLPAGLGRMNLFVFSLCTSLGAGIWVTALALVGFLIGRNEILLKQKLRELTLAFLAFCLLAAFLYVAYHARKGKLKSVVK